LHDVRKHHCAGAYIVHMTAAMAAASAVEGRSMHPQIANSFISLLVQRERPASRKRFWLFRLIGRA
jgi:hypothetical protein